jgi:hypothetical protein
MSSSSPSFHIGAPPSKGSPPKIDLDARRQRTIKEGTDAIDKAISAFPMVIPASDRDALLKSVEAHAKADIFVQDPNMGSRTVMSDGNHAISSKAPPKFLPGLPETAAFIDPRFVYVPESEITKYCKTIGHESKNDSTFHADKQVTTYLAMKGEPLPPLGDSRIMCKDCFNFFAKQSAATGKTLYITDPCMIMTFYPDGTVTSFCYKFRELKQSTELPSTPSEVEKGCVFVTNSKTEVTTKYKPDNTIIEYQPDGTQTTLHPNGAKNIRYKTGAEIAHQADGTVLEYGPGHLLNKETRPDGTVITYERKFTKTDEDPKYASHSVESKFETRPDKSVLITTVTTKYLKGPTFARDLETEIIEYNPEGEIIDLQLI